MTPPTDSAQASRRRALREILIFGLCGGLAIVALKLIEYRFLVIEHSVDRKPTPGVGFLRP